MIAAQTVHQAPVQSNPIATAGGEIVPGYLIELVSLGDHELGLQSFSETKMVVLDESQVLEGKTYKPIELSDSLRRAIYFPSCAAESSRNDELLPAMIRTLKQYAEVPDSTLSALGVWAIATWISDFLPQPLSLLVSGDFDHAISLLDGLHICVRRGLRIAELNYASLRGCPFVVSPTLLINGATSSKKIVSTLLHTNVAGYVVPGPRFSLQSLVGPRAIYRGEEQPKDCLTPNVIRVHLPPRCSLRPYASGTELRKQTAELQTAALAYRVRYWRESRGSVALTPAATSGLQQLLFSAIANQSQHQENLVPFLEAQRQVDRERQLLDPDRALVEVLWSPIHEAKSLSVTDVADRLNTVLRDRGEINVFSSIEVGQILRRLDIPRRRGQNNKVVVGTRELIERLHDLARRFGLQLPPHDSCAPCKAQTAEMKSDMLKYAGYVEA